MENSKLRFDQQSSKSKESEAARNAKALQLNEVQ
jgi:hypothetical protein